MRQLQQVEIAKMRQLANFLETVPVRKFNLDKWDDTYYNLRTVLSYIGLEKACGFAGCAMGWAAYSELFDGLKLENGMIKYKGYTCFTAAAQLFNINYQTSLYLFDPECYLEYQQQPGYVAARLNKFADKVESRLKRHQQPKLRLVA